MYEFGLIIPAHKRINALQQQKCNVNNCGHTFWWMRCGLSAYNHLFE